MIKKLFNNNLQYNLLSLVNVFIGFLFIIVLGRKFGAGSQTDIYFLSMIVVTYLGYFIQSVWEAMSPYYIELKLKDKQKSDELYSILLNDLILVSLVIIVLYFASIYLFEFLSSETKQFLNIFIFYIIFQNILFLNKTVLNLEHFYASFYIVDIFVYVVLFITIFFLVNTKLYIIAYAMILVTFIANLWQFYLIFRKLNISYSFTFYDKSLKEIYKNSFKLKIGSLFYGSKDIIIASVFTSFGSGTYSLYSYANKFAGVILQVVNAPIVNIFATKANYHVANKRYDLLKNDIKKVLMRTTGLFIGSATVTYFILPFVLSFLFRNKFVNEDILTIQNIFLIIVVFYFVWIIQSPYGRLLSIFKLFNFEVVTNIVFALVLSFDYILFLFIQFDYYVFLVLFIFSQIMQFILVYIKSVKYMRDNLI